jgi:hypothetical protein
LIIEDTNKVHTNHIVLLFDEVLRESNIYHLISAMIVNTDCFQLLVFIVLAHQSSLHQL